MTVSKARNLLIITLDSVRADHVHGRALAGLAAEGTYFTQAITCAPSTPESHAAMFSGCYPPIHGLRNHRARSNDRTPHLLETLEGAGFQVAACTRLASMPARIIGGPDDLVAALHEIRGWTGARRHALFFHVWRTHFPYLIASPTLRSQPPTAIMQGLLDPEIRPVILAGYEQALRCAEDELIAPLAEALRRQGAWDDTLTVIWSDHGEAFGAGGEPFHGFSLVDETLRVPLLLRGPGVPAGLIIEHQVRTIDIAPTVLDLLGVSSDHRFFWRPEGESLAPWLEDPGARAHRLAYAECCAGGKSIGLGRPFDVAADAALPRRIGFRHAVRMPPWKLVAGAEGARLFDLRRAAPEDEPVEAVGGMTVPQARATLEHTLLGVDSASEVAAEAHGGHALLESLGYLDESATQAAAAPPGDTLEDGDGLYPSYDLLWPTAGGQLAAPRLVHYHHKTSHCELSNEHLYILGLAGAGRTLRMIIADLAARLSRRDPDLLAVFPQFALGPEQLASTLGRLRSQGFLVDREGGVALAPGVELDVVESVVRRAEVRLAADLDGLEAVAIEHLLAGSTPEQALAQVRDHAEARLCAEAREILGLAAGRHLLRVRKAEHAPRPGA